MKNLCIVMYHYVRDLRHSRYPEIKGLDFELFRQQIRFLKENFHIVRMEDVIEAVMTGKKLPEKAALLTFDDGYADHFTNVFPVLMEEGVQGSFFIPGKTFVEHKLLDVNKIHFILAAAPVEKLKTELFSLLDYYRGSEFAFPSNEELYREYGIASRFDDADVIFAKRILQTVLPEELRNIISSRLFEKYIGMSEEAFAYELYMRREQIRCMKNCGMHIGLHGYDHYWLGNLNGEDMKRDIKEACHALQEFMDSEWVMNYPYGSYNEEVIRAVKEAGGVLGLSTRVSVADLDRDDCYALPRLDTNDFPPKSENYKHMWGQ